MTKPALTIGRLARAAAVNVETVRYYQARKLLPIPSRGGNAFRHYSADLVERIRFNNRAQELGFSLEEVRGLLRLHDGTDRVSIRKIAALRLEQIEAKLEDLTRMRVALSALIEACHHTANADPCPIIQALAPRQSATSCPSPMRSTR
jgi:MerR family mercuric resistance operon transcriptional regulator